jgi:hypothetical protein
VIEHSPPDELLIQANELMDVVITNPKLNPWLDPETIEAVLEMALGHKRLAECETMTSAAAITGLVGSKYVMITMHVKSASGYQANFVLRIAICKEKQLRIITLL